MAYSNWDTTAANNDDASPDGFPEGMKSSEVNDAARQLMADLATFRDQTLVANGNFIGNSSGIIQQSDDYTLVKDAYGYAGDMFEGMATGTAVSAGTLTTTSTANCGLSGHAHKFTGVTLTGSGVLKLRTKIESADAVHFKNQTASLSLKVYHDVGSSVTFRTYVRKADSQDNFAATTDIGDDGGVSVPSATETTLEYKNISMGDCSNGIEVEVVITSGAVTGKSFEVTEMQLEFGSNTTPYKPASIASELHRCRRYLQVFSASDVRVICNAAAITTTEARGVVRFPEMRVAPTGSVVSGAFNFFAPNTSSVSSITFSRQTTTTCELVAALGTPFPSAGDAGVLRSTSGGGKIQFDARL